MTQGAIVYADSGTFLVEVLRSQIFYLSKNINTKAL